MMGVVHIAAQWQRLVAAAWGLVFSTDWDPADGMQGVTLMSLDDCLAKAEFFSLHMPLTPQTKVLPQTTADDFALPPCRVELWHTRRMPGMALSSRHYHADSSCWLCRICLVMRCSARSRRVHGL
jgi:hypothetical protein